MPQSNVSDREVKMNPQFLALVDALERRLPIELRSCFDDYAGSPSDTDVTDVDELVEIVLGERAAAACA